MSWFGFFGFAFLQNHTKWQNSHILICWKELCFATGLCSKFFLYLTLCIDYQENKIFLDDGAHLTGKIKNGWHSLPLYFSQNQPLVLLSAWVKTNTQCSPMRHIVLRTSPVRQEQSGSLTPVALYQFFVVLQPNATHTLTDSHTGQMKNVYDITKAGFPTSHHRTKAQKLPSANRESGENPPLCTLGKALIASRFKNSFMYWISLTRAFYKKRTICLSFLQNLIKGLAKNNCWGIINIWFAQMKHWPDKEQHTLLLKTE